MNDFPDLKLKIERHNFEYENENDWGINLCHRVELFDVPFTVYPNVKEVAFPPSINPEYLKFFPNCEHLEVRNYERVEFKLSELVPYIGTNLKKIEFDLPNWNPNNNSSLIELLKKQLLRTFSASLLNECPEEEVMKTILEFPEIRLKKLFLPSLEISHRGFLVFDPELFIKHIDSIHDLLIQFPRIKSINLSDDLPQEIKHRLAQICQEVCALNNRRYISVTYRP